MNHRKIVTLIISCFYIMGNTSVRAEETSKYINKDMISCELNVKEFAFNSPKTSDISKEKKVQYMGGVPYKHLQINQNYTVDSNMTPKYIVVHDTDNEGYKANAYAHYTYFNNNYVSASAHYFVDDTEVIQTVDDNKIAWHSGDSYPGVNPKVPDAKNSNSIGIEMCVNSDSNYNKTYNNTIRVVKELMRVHNIPGSNVIMHNDVTGKYCSRKMLDNPVLWDNFKKEIYNGKDVSEENNNSNNEEISNEYKEGIVTYEYLNIRKGPSTSYDMVGRLKKNDTIKITESSGDFFKMEFNGIRGYVHKSYVHVKITENSSDNNNSSSQDTADKYKEGKVTVNSLNIRKGPGTNYEVIGGLIKNHKVKVIYNKGEFLKIEFNGIVGYVHKDYVNIINGNMFNSGFDNNNSSDKNSSNKYKEGMVTASSLNIRKGPGTNYEVVGGLVKNQRVKIIEIKDDFIKMEFNGISGYVHKDYIASSYS